MPVITLPLAYLERLVGRERDQILQRIPMFGADIERVGEGEAAVEFFANRPDLFCTEGVARALRGFLGIEKGMPRYRVVPSGIRFSVDPRLSEIRPYLGSAVIREVRLDEESIASLMGLQEALHWAVGRGRRKVAIGIHDLDRVKPPFRYLAADPDRAFVPLDFAREMTMREMLREHPKGRAYAHLVEPFRRYPLIEDSEGHVLSFPPIINGELTRVTTGTRNILLDTTGTDPAAVMTAVNIICTAFTETGAAIESVEIDGREVPSLAPEVRRVSVPECSALLGIALTPEEMAEHLRSMRYDAAPEGEDHVRVEIPCYRADIMHDWDVFEDVAIAYGYERFEPELPSTPTIGRPNPVTELGNAVREIMAGLGFLEMMPFTLTNERVLFRKMQREPEPDVLRVLHPISEEHTVVRTELLPLLLEELLLNLHRPLPQRLFAVGDVVQGVLTHQQISAVSMHMDAGYSEMYAAFDALCRELGLTYRPVASEDSAFIEGRRVDAYIGGVKRGVFGEIHPAVLNAFGLEHPVAALELDLRALPEFHGRRGSPSPGLW